jgi:hypothetical protein
VDEVVGGLRAVGVVASGGPVGVEEEGAVRVVGADPIGGGEAEAGVDARQIARRVGVGEGLGEGDGAGGEEGGARGGENAEEGGVVDAEGAVEVE